MKKSSGLSFYQAPKKVNTSIFSEIFICLVWMFIAAFMAVVAAYFFGMTIHMVGSSMEPELYAGQKLLVNRFFYVMSAPKKGDVVVFLPRGNEKSHYYVKRVAAGPGDVVQITEGILYVNEEAVEWGTEQIAEAGIAANPLTLQNGQYFCIGDNPWDGEDSRQANIGPVSKEDIIGRAWFRMKTEETDWGFIR